MTEKRIVWVDALEEGNKISNAFNRKEEFLGCLKYERMGRFMHWCWYQIPGIRMSPGCLQEVRDKQKELLKLKNGK